MDILYDPAHLYVLHVDRRSEALHDQLAAALASRYPDRTRVRLISRRRSFATDWGSDKIIRAELEVRRASEAQITDKSGILVETGGQRVVLRLDHRGT